MLYMLTLDLSPPARQQGAGPVIQQGHTQGDGEEIEEIVISGQYNTQLKKYLREKRQRI